MLGIIKTLLCEVNYEEIMKGYDPSLINKKGSLIAMLELLGTNTPFPLGLKITKLHFQLNRLCNN